MFLFVFPESIHLLLCCCWVFFCKVSVFKSSSHFSSNSKGVNLNHLLPHDVLSDILSRLPVTSLLQVKLTCKLWNSLIVDDPSFPSKHLTHAAKNPGHLYTLIDYPNFYFAENQLDNNNTTVSIKLPRQVENNDLGEDTLYLFGKKKFLFSVEYDSCHGLVCHCLIKEQSIHVFNPIIKEHVRLPDRPLPTLLSWGFGFAPITHKYKCYCYSARKLEDDTWVFSSALYTLGDDESWRETSSPPYPISKRWKHVYCKGALYWAIRNEKDGYLFPQAYTKSEPGRFNILSLDLDTEKFRERQIDHDYKTHEFYLAVVGETVATVAHMSNGLKVLFLTDEGKDIWELKYTIPFRIWNEIRCVYDTDFMGLWMNQVLYFCERDVNTSSRGLYDGKCFSYNPSDNKFSAICFPFPKDAHCEIGLQLILSHVGTLVSPIKIVKAGKQQLSNLS